MVGIINGYFKSCVGAKYLSLISVDKNYKFQFEYKRMFTSINYLIREKYNYVIY